MSAKEKGENVLHNNGNVHFQMALSKAFLNHTENRS